MRAGFVDEGNLGAALAAQCIAEPCGQFQSAGPSADDNNTVWLTRLVSMARPLPATCADAGVGIALASEHGVDLGGRRIIKKKILLGMRRPSNREKNWERRPTLFQPAFPRSRRARTPWQ